MVYYAAYPSPVGELLLTSDGISLTGLWMNRETPAGEGEEPEVLCRAKQWLDAYFRGEDRPVDFSLAPEGSEFQKKVWDILLTIPYGKTLSYGTIARMLGEKMSAQAVGGAVGRNPISILIPCHRVVGAQGQLTGYAGGLDKKRWLLDHEGISYRR
ncbi:MAG: methylated-DNA--[Oscillospiraceae bacterium]|nr:methylated-DNA--[protein]-cysteine S-methyltransferase [Oscillospiraceae bacterium]